MRRKLRLGPWMMSLLLLLAGPSEAQPGPAPPADLKVNDGNLMAQLSWSPVRGKKVAGYNIYRREATEPTFTRINPRPETTVRQAAAKPIYIYEDHSVHPGRTYLYAVAAVDPQGREGPMTEPVSISWGGTRKGKVRVDAGAAGHSIDQSLYGGKFAFFWNEDLARDIKAMKALGPQLWIWLTDINDTSGYRWDTHSLVKGSGMVNNQLFNLGQGVILLDVHPPNEITVDFWQGTDLRHSAIIRKVSGAPEARIRIPLNTDELRRSAKFIRFDVKIDSERPFAAPRGGWVLFQTLDLQWRSILRVRLTSDRRLLVQATNSRGRTHPLPPSPPLELDRWYSLELFYDMDNPKGAAAYWLDGKEVGRVALDATGKKVANLYIGAVASPHAAGQIHLDALRIDRRPIGQDLDINSPFLFRLTFDANMATIDDVIYWAQQASARLVIQVMTIKDPKVSTFSTPQFWADLVEYVNGKADLDYRERVKTLDWSHNNPRDNWANLRAARGHVEPYGIQLWQIGSEPYYAEGLSSNQYREVAAPIIRAMKEVDPSISIGLHGKTQDWWDVLLPAFHDDVGWLSVWHVYSRIPGISHDRQRGWWLGNAEARFPIWWSPKPQEWEYFSWHQQARAKINQHLARRADKDQIFTIMSEHNFSIIYPPGTGHWLGDAIYRASWLGRTMRDGPLAGDGVWLWANAQRFSYGVIGNHQLTPSYYVYLLFKRYFGTTFLPSQVTSDDYWKVFGTTNTNYRMPYLSAYASRSADKERLYLILVNRSLAERIETTIHVENFSSQSRGILRKLGGAGYNVYSHNAESSQNVTLKESDLGPVGSTLTVTLEPLSINGIELRPK